MADEKKISKGQPDIGDDRPEEAVADPQRAAKGNRVKFEIFGEEMIEKRVKASGNSGRVYLPPDWVGHRVKIIRVD